MERLLIEAAKWIGVFPLESNSLIRLFSYNMGTPKPSTKACKSMQKHAKASLKLIFDKKIH